MNDPINPSHYTQGSVECIEAIEASMTSEAFKGFLKGNCIKYLFRYEKKNGLEDLEKCNWYLNHLLATERIERIAATQQEKKTEEVFGLVNHDPDDYMISGCPDGFCPMPNVRQGPSEEMFKPVS
jgi:hypothetical protein